MKNVRISEDKLEASGRMLRDTVGNSEGIE